MNILLNLSKLYDDQQMIVYCHGRNDQQLILNNIRQQTSQVEALVCHQTNAKRNLRKKIFHFFFFYLVLQYK